MPKVSFLLPVYNGERYLAETLESLIAQDHDDYDIVIVDDGSTDRTAQIIDAVGSAKITYLRKENGGLVDALNFGLERLDCDFVARIDADDVCFPTRLSQQLDFIAFTGAAAVSGQSLHINTEGQVLGLSGTFGIFNADPEWLPAIEPYLPHPFLFARLDVLRSLGYRHAHLAEDADLCWRLADDWPIAMQTRVLGKYRLHDESVSARSLHAARVQAYYSQIAAMNALRRRDGIEELSYAVDRATAMTAGESWDGLMALHADALDDAAQARLRAAAVLKLLDLASWRKFAPLTQDIAEAALALRQVRGLSSGNMESARNLIAGSTPATPEEKPNSLGQRLFNLLNPR